jgi:hypothetical protein
LATLFPQESRTFRSNQLCILKEKTAGSSYSEPYFKTSLSFMFFSCNPQWMEEICDTPAEKLACRDPTDACVEEAWQTVGGKGADF